MELREREREREREAYRGGRRRAIATADDSGGERECVCEKRGYGGCVTRDISPILQHAPLVNFFDVSNTCLFDTSKNC